VKGKFSNFWYAFANLAHIPTCRKIWLSSARWPPFEKTSSTQHLRKVGKYDSLTFRRLWNKVHEILRRCRQPLTVSNTLAGSLHGVSFRRYSPRSRWKNEQMYKVFCPPPQFLGGITPTFCDRLLARLTFSVWLSSDCWPPCAKPGDEVECRILRRVGKNFGPLSRFYTKVHDILKRCRGPL